MVLVQKDVVDSVWELHGERIKRYSESKLLDGLVDFSDPAGNRAARGKSPATLQPIELLGAWAAQRGLNPQALMKLLIAGRLILIFKGFDEMAEVGDTEARLKHFRNLWRFCYPGSKLAFTGRPNLLLDQQERRAALGIDESSGSGPSQVSSAAMSTSAFGSYLSCHPAGGRQGCRLRPLADGRCL